MTGPQLAEEVGVSYRQIDYWTRKGWLQARMVDQSGEEGVNRAGNGSGLDRDYPPAEVRKAIVIARLVKAGVSVHRAAEYAQQGKTGVIL